MTSSRCPFFVTLLLFCILFQQNIQKSAANCVDPSFDASKKITINYFLSATDETWPDTNVCELVNKSNGLISIKYRMISDMKDKDSCKKEENCMENRRMACFYKLYQNKYDDCNQTLPPLGADVADCTCDGSADDILTGNYAELTGYGVQKTPALVVDKTYDPCLTDFSIGGLKIYFCKAYNNVLPICSG